MKLWVLLIITAMLSSCSPDPEEHVFSVAAYNAYCLFDGIRDGDEFEGWRKSDGYTEAVYDKRVGDLTVLLGKYVSADVIILEEVESEIVLRDLIDSGLRKKGYFHYGLATTGNEAISVGFLSRIRPDAVRIHSFDGERPMLELSLTAAGERITIFGVHLKSRIGGGYDERDGQLRHLSSLIAARQDSLVIVAGDFNIDPRMEGEALCEYPWSYSENAVMPVSGDPGRVQGGVLYAPLLDDMVTQPAPGTYFHEGSWYIYDSILTDSSAIDGTGFEIEEARIIAEPHMLDLLSRPLAFDPSTGNGYSDHLPVIASFRKAVL